MSLIFSLVYLPCANYMIFMYFRDIIYLKFLMILPHNADYVVFLILHPHESHSLHLLAVGGTIFYGINSCSVYT